MTLDHLQARYATMAEEYRLEGHKRPNVDDFAEWLGSSGTRLYEHCRASGFSARDILQPYLKGTFRDKNGEGHQE